MPWQPSAYLNLRENKRKTESNLIGSGTRNELVTEVSLMLGGAMVLDQSRSAPQSTLRQGQVYVIVRLSSIVLVVEPTHDDDLCKAWRDE
jgi:hypothetical protein